LNLSYFIAKRVARNRKSSFSRFIIRLATVATALSVAVMIISVAVVLGFKETVKNKMFVFWGHLEITEFNPNPSSVIAPAPFENDPLLLQKIRAVRGVRSVHPYALKPAILHAKNTMEGVKLKGVGRDFAFKSNGAIAFSGEPITFSDTGYAQQIVLSQTTLNRLEVQTGDTLLALFINPEQEFPRIRKLRIVGTYHTGMQEIDQSFALCDIRLLRRISNWDDQAINGYQVTLADYRKADSTGDIIYRQYLQPPLTVNSMQDIYPNIFNWLALMNTNAYIILVIMAVVAIINMATALLIFIMERSHMIGVLKTMGMSLKRIQGIFMYHAAIVAFKGILYGTLVGAGFCLLQEKAHLIRLDESAYYMQYVPIKLVGWHVLLIDCATLAFCVLVMLLPSVLVRKISIIRAIRFK
jgi:lipoprotein-releasing system permease protein